MLRTALGPAIAAFLGDPSVVEMMLNPDGRLWVDRLSEGLSDTGERLTSADGERIVHLVAHHVGAEVHPARPRVSAELPETRERFEGLLPPVVQARTFAIPQARYRRLHPAGLCGRWDHDRRAGRDPAPGGYRPPQHPGRRRHLDGLANALLAEVSKTSDRVVLIEDTRELQCAAPNLVAIAIRCGLARSMAHSPALSGAGVAATDVRAGRSARMLAKWHSNDSNRPRRL